MKDHSENTLRAAVKSLRDTVAPAVDPSDAQANEQLRLTIDFLEFLRTRIYDVHARHRYELGHQLALGRALVADAAEVSDLAAERLGAAVQQAAAVHASAGAHTRDLQVASEELWACVRGLLRDAGDAPEAVRTRITTQVISGIEPLVQMESAWYVPFGFEPDPSSITSLEDLLPLGVQHLP